VIDGVGLPVPLSRSLSLSFSMAFSLPPALCVYGRCVYSVGRHPLTVLGSTVGSRGRGCRRWLTVACALQVPHRTADMPERFKKLLVRTRSCQRVLSM
jgi:hypothetical protein